MPKYKRTAAILNSEVYFDVFERKGLKFLRIHRTTSFKGLRGREIPLRARHVWSKTDKLHKLAEQYYGDNTYWWVIAMFNKKPTDAHYSIGDITYIPEDPILILNLIELPEVYGAN